MSQHVSVVHYFSLRVLFYYMDVAQSFYCFQLWEILNKPIRNIHIKLLCENRFLFQLDVGLLGHMVSMRVTL